MKHFLKKIILLLVLSFSLNTFSQLDSDRGLELVRESRKLINNNNFIDALRLLEEVENEMGDSLHIIWALRTKAYFGNEQYREARISVDRYFYLDVDETNERRLEMLGYLERIDGKLTNDNGETEVKQLTYFNQKLEQTTRADAVYYVDRPKNYGSKYLVELYYVVNDEIRLKGESLNDDIPYKFDGIVTTYFENEELQLKVEYINGLPYNILESKSLNNKIENFGNLKNGVGKLLFFDHNEKFVKSEFYIRDEGRFILKQVVSNFTDKSGNFKCFNCLNDTDLILQYYSESQFGYVNGKMAHGLRNKYVGFFEYYENGSVRKLIYNKYGKGVDRESQLIRDYFFDLDGNVKKENIYVLKRGKRKLKESIDY